jgi:capsular polysaccharide transport system permease protein
MTELQVAARTQARVVWALMLRETRTLFGKHKLGYLWALINAVFSIGIFWTIRELAGFHPPQGLSTPVFLICGFIPYYLFSETSSGGMNAISGNRALLAYPQVFPLDLLVARALLHGAMYLLVGVILLGIAAALGHKVDLQNPAGALLALLLALLLGFGLGGLLSACNLMFPATARIVPMLMRVLFFTSGLFFSVEGLPAAARNILFYNPMSHLIEMLRGCFAEGYGARFVYLPYVAGLLLSVLALGLLLERYSRRYLDRAA